MGLLDQKPQSATTKQKQQTGTRRALACLKTLALAAGLALPLSSGAQAEIYGLIIGINDYVGEKNDLAGAVNDAVDISNTLKKIGATRIVTLLDKDAKKQRIQSEWFNMVRQAKPGDTLIFTYAGHGSQEPEPKGRNGEEDGMNENFLLANYTPKGPGRAERIVDDEMFQWLRAADNKGLRVVFVADSCHSGTMFRSAPATGVKFRNGDFDDLDLEDDLLKLPKPELAHVKESDFKSVTFVGATLENRLTPEIPIDGKPRGALSWAFARALEGSADRNGDKILTQAELLNFLVPTIQHKAQSQQIPQVQPLRAGNTPVLAQLNTGSALGLPQQAQTSALTISETYIRLFVRNSTGLPTLPQGVAYAANETSADLIWDRNAGTIDHRLGGRVAENVTLTALPGVLNKWAVLGYLNKASRTSPVAFTLTSGNQTYKPGQVVRLSMRQASKPYLTLFNLPPNGRVELFIPANSKELVKDWRTTPFVERFRVERPPYGSEHLVAILTDQPLPSLHQQLNSMSTPANAASLLRVLHDNLNGRDFQLGIVGVYTSGD